MEMRKIKATKSLKYGTRQLTAGEEYEVPKRHAFALVAGKKAHFADKTPKTTAAPVAAPAAIHEPAPAAEVTRPQSHAVGAMTYSEARGEDAHALDQLRLQATQLGINVDGRWGTARLRHEIEQAKSPIRVEDRR